MKTFLLSFVVLVCLYLALLAVILKVLQPPVSHWQRQLEPTEIYKLYLYDQLGGNYKKFRLMERIAFCESSWIETAYNHRTRDSGIFQINERWHGSITDPFDNIKYAVALYEKQGTRPWKASAGCWKYSRG